MLIDDDDDEDEDEEDDDDDGDDDDDDDDRWSMIDELQQHWTEDLVLSTGFQQLIAFGGPIQTCAKEVFPVDRAMLSWPCTTLCYRTRFKAVHPSKHFLRWAEKEWWTFMNVDHALSKHWANIYYSSNIEQ